jgi:hypothetical protein
MEGHGFTHALFNRTGGGHIQVDTLVGCSPASHDQSEPTSRKLLSDIFHWYPYSRGWLQEQSAATHPAGSNQTSPPDGWGSVDEAESIISHSTLNKMMSVIFTRRGRWHQEKYHRITNSSVHVSWSHDTIPFELRKNNNSNYNYNNNNNNNNNNNFSFHRRFWKALLRTTKQLNANTMPHKLNILQGTLTHPFGEGGRVGQGTQEKCLQIRQNVTNKRFARIWTAPTQFFQ